MYFNVRLVVVFVLSELGKSRGVSRLTSIEALSVNHFCDPREAAAKRHSHKTCHLVEHPANFWYNQLPDSNNAVKQEFTSHLLPKL